MQATRRKALITLASLPFILHPYNAFASDAFEQIVREVRTEAASRGVSERTLSRALDGVQPISSIKKHETSQPEKRREITFSQYYNTRATPSAITRAKRLGHEHAAELRKAQDLYGVPDSLILAIWSIETNFGDIAGDKKVIPALLTLVRDVEGDTPKARERRAMFREEAVQALMLVDQGYNEIVTGFGSWAGAIGHTQFMPSSLRKYGVDASGDGKVDLWNNLADVFASTAHYLREKGWKPGERWGREVKLPEGFDLSLLTDRLDGQINKTPRQWAELGVRLPEGDHFPDDSTMKAMIIAPDFKPSNGVLKGPVYMVYDNFRTIMEYNKSYKYALTVAMMMDRIGHPSQLAAPAAYNP